eukprot:SAG31_NODE_6075_length_2177_cov_1.352546_3_plen_83_part_00
MIKLCTTPISKDDRSAFSRPAELAQSRLKCSAAVGSVSSIIAMALANMELEKDCDKSTKDALYTVNEVFGRHDSPLGAGETV